MTARTILRSGLAAAGACLALAGPAPAQPAKGCQETTRFDPPLKVVRCADGLTIEAERDAPLRTIDRDGDGRLEGAELGGRAVLVDMPRRPARGGGFQILTPHAIASVRGTVYAVDVTSSRTSVFVRNGRVAVQRTGGGAAVTLGPGEGVDVGSDAAPLEVKRWGAERVASLLSRFGR